MNVQIVQQLEQVDESPMSGLDTGIDENLFIEANKYPSNSTLEFEDKQLKYVSINTINNYCLVTGKNGLIRIHIPSMKIDDIISKEPIGCTCEMQIADEDDTSTYVVYNKKDQNYLKNTMEIKFNQKNQKKGWIGSMVNYYYKWGDNVDGNNKVKEKHLVLPVKDIQRTLYFYDVKQKEIIFEFERSSNEEVIVMKYVKNHLLVITANHIEIYKVQENGTLKLIQLQKTCYNPFGLCGVSSHLLDPRIAIPSISKGHIECIDLKTLHTHTIPCHQGSIRNICLDHAGHFIATASSSGTMIRIWNWEVKTKYEPVKEFRRGSMHASIECINFSTDSSTIIVSSSRSIHWFSLKSPNVKSYLNGLPGYFSSEWSRKKCSSIQGPAYCCFDAHHNDRIHVVTPCYLYKLQFNKTDDEPSMVMFDMATILKC
mmetsp:Transcript_325/g.590  ORF Transcript_325/g.590 Transcript_325/m.590 type:complete len:428 (-) Transcript_325:2889-4172(-)